MYDLFAERPRRAFRSIVKSNSMVRASVFQATTDDSDLRITSSGDTKCFKCMLESTIMNYGWFSCVGKDESSRIGTKCRLFELDVWHHQGFDRDGKRMSMGKCDNAVIALFPRPCCSSLPQIDKKTTAVLMALHQPAARARPDAPLLANSPESRFDSRPLAGIIRQWTNYFSTLVNRTSL
jgi:hypothetical protein